MDKLDPQKDGASAEIVADNIDALKHLFPDIITEGKIDFDALRDALGDYVDERQERYNFTWHGKGMARKIAQTPSTGTLRPCPEESVNWDTTQNLFIEGDNLEVLKLLQKSYHRKVKMIYIDPPYNTGKEFIYPDKYQDNLQTYLRYTGQVDEEGLKLSANAETSGRYHTNWLNMMLPRLKLARNLLREDGLLFVSIGDVELANLCKLCDEVFGEENRVGLVTWKARVKPVNIGDAKYRPQKEVEYVLIYQRAYVEGSFRPLYTGGVRTYPHDLDGRKYRLTTILKSNRGTNRRTTMVFELEGYTPPEGQRWQAGEDVIRQLYDDGSIEFVDGTPFRRYFEDEEGAEHDPFYCFMEVDWSSTSEAGKNQLNHLIGDAHGFDTVKPTRLIQTLIQSCTRPHEEDLILDFFAGSCTTAHAVFLQNMVDGGNRHFIGVQLPEPCGDGSEFETVTDIGKLRMRRAIDETAEMQAQRAEEVRSNLPGTTDEIPKLDLGFKVFQLDSSNVKPWDGDFDNLDQALFNAVENVKEDRAEADVLYELLLKYGLDLAVPMEQREIVGKTVFVIGGGALIVCLATDLTLDVVDGIAALKDELQPELMRVVFRDAGFKDDVVKTNAVQILRQTGIEDVKSL